MTIGPQPAQRAHRPCPTLGRRPGDALRAAGCSDGAENRSGQNPAQEQVGEYVGDLLGRQAAVL
ncbi:MAG TPA: hypothetical protein VGL99_06510, partial [Chloroflexota bacterium]